MKRRSKWEIYRSPNDGLWYWHKVASNGQITAAAEEGRSRRSAAVANARKSGYRGK